MTHHAFDARALDPRQLALIFQGSVSPRPIAWASTISAAGMRNLAPFSYFNAINTNPPLIMFSVGVYRDGRSKDTLNNLREVPEVVVHIASADQIGVVEVTGTEYAPEVDEFAEGRLTAIPAETVRPFRVAEAPIAMECRVVELHPLPEGAKSTLVIARVERFHIRADLLTPDGGINTLGLAPLSRLSRKDYGILGRVEDGQHAADAFRRQYAPDFD